MKRPLTLLLGLALLMMACNFMSLVAGPTLTVETPTAEITDTPIPPTDTPTPTGTHTATPPPADYGPDNFPNDVNPLTGLPVSDPTRLERRPLSIKIQLFPREERPPIGISFADIVYDYYQNNGLTRFNAIFLGNDVEQVGPVRSARLLDAAIIRMYKTIFAFGGADKKILNQLYNSDFYNRLVVEGSHNCPPMCRVDPNGYNFLITNTLELGKYVVGKGVDNGRQNLNGMKFQYLPPENGQLGLQIYARYSISSYNRWDFDQGSGKYLRFQDTQEDQGGGENYLPMGDRITNIQLMADNVVVIFIPHSYAYKSGNSEVIDIEMVSSGPGVAFRDGLAYEVRWTRPAPDSVLTLTFPDGTPFPYKPGVTWYQVMGMSSIKETQEGGIWRFEIKFP